MDKRREQYRSLRKGYYHFCTDGLKEDDIFHNAAEYAFGMILMGLVSIKFSLKIYVFTLMSNHIHIILCGTGADSLRAFDYLRRKLSARRKKNGYPPLPEDYWFKLIPIETPEQMKNEIVYVLRNPLEKGLGMAGGYLWGSGWIYYSGFSEVFGASVAGKEMSGRSLEKLLGGEEKVPDEWRFHPYLGLLPDSFVDISMVQKLFPEPKDLQTALVKDYEVYFQIAGRLGELCEFSQTERESIVSQTLQKRFGGRDLDNLSDVEKGKLAIILHQEFGLNSYQISTSIYMKEKTVRQLLGSKELR